MTLTRRDVLAAMASGALGLTVGSVLLQATSAQAVAPFPVVNWWGGVPSYNDDYAEHVARGSLNPGVDWGMPVGTIVRAPHGGSMTIDNVGDLWQVNIRHSSGWRSELLHVSGFIGSAGAVSIGANVAYSGGQPGQPGAGPSGGPHLHWSFKTPSGTNVDPLLYVNTTPDGIPIEEEQRKDLNMLGFALKVSSTANFSKWALAGAGTGAAAWIELPGTGPTNPLANRVATFMGSAFIVVDQDEWNFFKTSFTS